MYMKINYTEVCYAIVMLYNYINVYTFAQNKLIASAGTPLLLNADNVNSLGSSQSLNCRVYVYIYIHIYMYIYGCLCIYI